MTTFQNIVSETFIECLMIVFYIGARYFIGTFHAIFTKNIQYFYTKTRDVDPLTCLIIMTTISCHLFNFVPTYVYDLEKKLAFLRKD
jgi:hypothetical protein